MIVVTTVLFDGHYCIFFQISPPALINGIISEMKSKRDRERQNQGWKMNFGSGWLVQRDCNNSSCSKKSKFHRIVPITFLPCFLVVDMLKYFLTSGASMGPSLLKVECVKKKFRMVSGRASGTSTSKRNIDDHVNTELNLQ